MTASCTVPPSRDLNCRAQPCQGMQSRATGRLITARNKAPDDEHADFRNPQSCSTCGPF